MVKDFRRCIDYLQQERSDIDGQRLAYCGFSTGGSYGTIILAFMSGVLWGFATRAPEGQAATGYALSVLPALWAFFMVGGGPTASAVYLIAGFTGLLLLDWSFWRRGLAPEWWMQLRIRLTVVVVACLSLLVL